MLAASIHQSYIWSGLQNLIQRVVLQAPLVRWCVCVCAHCGAAGSSGEAASITAHRGGACRNCNGV